MSELQPKTLRVEQEERDIFERAIYLNPVHTSNNVEATGNKVVSCFDNVAGVGWALYTLTVVA